MTTNVDYTDGEIDWHKIWVGDHTKNDVTKLLQEIDLLKFERNLWIQKYNEIIERDDLGEKYIQVEQHWEEEDKRYITVDRNAVGEIFMEIKKEKTVCQGETVLELSRHAAFKLAYQLLENLISYPKDQVRRIEDGQKCACKHRAKMDEDEPR